MSSPASIRTTILSVLANVAPYALPAEQLLRDVNRMIAPPIPDGRTLHDEHMTWLLDRDFVAFQADDMDPEDGLLNRWLITNHGERQLQRQGVKPQR